MLPQVLSIIERLELQYVSVSTEDLELQRREFFYSKQLYITSRKSQHQSYCHFYLSRYTTTLSVPLRNPFQVNATKQSTILRNQIQQEPRETHWAPWTLNEVKIAPNFPHSRRNLKISVTDVSQTRLPLSKASLPKFPSTKSAPAPPPSLQQRQHFPHGWNTTKGKHFIIHINLSRGRVSGKRKSNNCAQLHMRDINSCCPILSQEPSPVPGQERPRATTTLPSPVAICFNYQNRNKNLRSLYSKFRAIYHFSGTFCGSLPG